MRALLVDINIDECNNKKEEREALLSEIHRIESLLENRDDEWPNTYGEALSRSDYWGMEIDGKRFFFSKGKIMNVEEVYSKDPDLSQLFWLGCGVTETGKYYSIKKFDNKKELYNWLTEG